MKFLITILLCSSSFTLAVDAQLLDLSKAVVIAPTNSTKQEQKAMQMLVDEIPSRTQIRPLIAHTLPADLPLIILNNDHTGAPEGYRISIDSSGPAAKITVTGNDSRGLLFGCGRLLRTLRLSHQKIEVPGNISINSSPKAKLRGHQLGYRPKTNSYDGWTVAMWEQYI